MFKEFKNVLEVSPFAEGTHWYTREDLIWIGDRRVQMEVTIPRGFVTDFASVPRVIWPLLPKWGKYGLPSVLHDFLYARGGTELDRKLADDAMLEAMEDMKESNLRAIIVHRALRRFGGRAWCNNAKQREQRVIRVIRDFPTTATVSWSAHRNQLKPVGDHDGLVVGGL